MPEPNKRSRTFRRIKTKLPGGRTTLHYKKRKPAAAMCPITHEQLRGVPRERPYKLKRLSKSQKRPSRPYAGHLSSKAMRSIMKEKARQL